MLHRYQNIIDQIDGCMPQNIVEVGTWKGVRAREMVNAAGKWRKNIHYYGFDLWEDMTDDTKQKELHSKRNAAYRLAVKSLRYCTAPMTYELCQGNTIDTLPLFKPDRPIDFVFIDGGHSLETIASDWSHISKLMHKGTVVIFDDYYENRYDYGCKTLINQLEHSLNFDVMKLDPVDMVNDLQIRLIKLTLI